MPAFPLPATWDRHGLEQVKFEGFVPLVGIDVTLLPPRRGVYVIIRESMEAPAFSTSSPISRRVPYPIAKLEKKWLPNQTVVYIGKADPADGILGRLGVFSKKSSSHTGGRALWQLMDAHTLIAAWVETPNEVAEEVEKRYLISFREMFGNYPFANWRG